MTLPLPGMGMVGGIMKMRPPFPLLPAAALAGAFLVQPFTGALKAGPVPAADPAGNAAAEAGNSGLNALLRDALFQEEATRDLPKAAAGYEALLAQWAAQRPTAAAALFRLAEVRRKQDRKPDAIALFQRLLREFPDVEPHAKLARENLTALGAREPSPLTAAEALQKGTWPGDPDPLISAEETAALQRIKKLALESPDLLRVNEFPEACEKGWLTVVQFILGVGIPYDTNGFTAAASKGHLAIVREIIKQKPAPEFLAAAVDAAASSGYLAVLKTLLEAGASPEGSNPENPALNMAISYSRSTGAAELLLAHKASADPAAALTSPLFAAASTENVSMVKRLLELKADPNRATNKEMGHGLDDSNDIALINPIGATPLHAAVGRGNAEIVKLLLDAKANPNAKNDAGWTPLRGAASYENLSMMELLLAAGADPNAEKGVALLAAVSSRNLAATNMLLKNGTMPDVVHDGRLSALQLAVSGKDFAMAKSLLEAGADPAFIPNPEQEGRAAIQIFSKDNEPHFDEWVALFVKHDPLFLSPGSSLLSRAPVPNRGALFRTHGYPVLAERPGIMLVFCEAARLSLLAERKSENEKPGPLPALLTAWNEKGGWKLPDGERFEHQPDWSTLRLWRKGTDGKMKETVIEVKKDTAWPELQWGDVVEVLAAPTPKATVVPEAAPPGSQAISPETLELLKPAK